MVVMTAKPFAKASVNQWRVVEEKERIWLFRSYQSYKFAGQFAVITFVAPVRRLICPVFAEWPYVNFPSAAMASVRGKFGSKFPAHVAIADWH